MHSFIELIKDDENKHSTKMNTLQVNVGKKCNLACTHCHVDAGPRRKEEMSKEVINKVLKVFAKHNFKILDITGGAPEMNSHFRYFIEEASKIAQKIIVRSNLVIMDEENFRDLPKFLADKKVEIVSSLPCYTQGNVDKMRGNGVFDSSIKILQELNSLGYGMGRDLILNLVYNPGGAFLPGDQAGLEKDYKRVLMDSFGISFDHLFTITNVPIGRFKSSLVRSKEIDAYMSLLEDNFNEFTLEKMMCRSQISVSYDGLLYDCDFNQMIDMKMNRFNTIEDLLFCDDIKREISFDNHCFASTAGSGSSCSGITAKSGE